VGFDRSRELVVEREVGKCTLGPSERISLAWAGNTLDIALYIMPASCSTYYEQKIYTAQTRLLSYQHECFCLAPVRIDVRI